jgi:catechol 2,3-dioxygenase-like lactoylglutathione lyase family enzyme
MAIQGMNHFTVLTDDVESTRKFYLGILGLAEGPRPPFNFDGAWFYVGSEPVLHIIARDSMPADPAGVLDHMAFTATDLRGTVARLKANGIEYQLRKQVGYGTWQIFFHDPNGAKVELDFSPDEPAPAGA